MPHCFLDEHQVHVGFIKVQSKRVAEAVEVKAGSLIALDS